MTKKEEFLKEFDNPEHACVCAIIDMPDCPNYEVIINAKPNFEAKKAYYANAYNDNLELKSFPKIKIEKYVFLDEAKFNAVDSILGVINVRV